MKTPLFTMPAGTRIGDIEVPPGAATAEEVAACINESDSHMTAKVVAPGHVEVGTREAIVVGVNFATEEPST